MISFAAFNALNFWRRHGINSVTAWLASMELNGIIIGIGWKTFGMWPATGQQLAGIDAEQAWKDNGDLTVLPRGNGAEIARLAGANGAELETLIQ
jgi:hypothetical protein